MKTSLAHLPEYTQAELKQIVELVLENISQCEMIILYGSYARGTFVEYDERVEFGVRTSFLSDYDLLVVTSGTEIGMVRKMLSTVEDKYIKHYTQQVPTQFICDDIKKLNSDLSEGRYFYTTVVQEGIMLYDSKKYTLEQRRKLNFEEIKQQAQGYYKDKIRRADNFYANACFDYEREDYITASFHLHQICENLFYALNLVFTLVNGKQHNLGKLLESTRKYSEELVHIFPRNNEEEERLFELLKLAYVEARYNSEFIVTKEDIDVLLPKVQRFRKAVEKACKIQIEEYEQKKRYPETEE